MAVRLVPVRLDRRCSEPSHALSIITRMAASDIKRSSFSPGRLQGNTDAVLACIEHSSEGCFLTGSEDGWVRVLDARSERGACSGWSCEWGPVGCVAARGPRHPHLFLAGSGSSLIEIDGRMSSDGGAHSCVREVYRCGEWGRGPPPGGDAEINAVAVHANGSLAAIADDDGVISIVKERQGSSGWDLERRVRPGHANIASAVAFAPHRPWCLLSGGLDCFLGCWDASTGKAKVRTVMLGSGAC